MSRWQEFGFPNPTFLQSFIPVTGLRLAARERSHFVWNDDKKEYDIIDKDYNAYLFATEDFIKYDTFAGYCRSQLVRFFYNISVPVPDKIALLSKLYGNDCSVPDVDIEQLFKMFLEKIGLLDYFSDVYYPSFYSEPYFNFGNVNVSELTYLNLFYRIINMCPYIATIYIHRKDIEEDMSDSKPDYYYYCRWDDSLKTYIHFLSSTKPSFKDGEYYYVYDMTKKFEFYDENPVEYTSVPIGYNTYHYQNSYYKGDGAINASFPLPSP